MLFSSIKRIDLLFLKILLISLKLGLLFYTIDVFLYYTFINNKVVLNFLVLILLISVLFFIYHLVKMRRGGFIFLLSFFIVGFIAFFIHKYTNGDPIYHFLKIHLGDEKLVEFALILTSCILLLEGFSMKWIQKIEEKYHDDLPNILDSFEDK